MPTQTWIAAADLQIETPPAEALRVQLVGGSVSVTGRAEPGIALEVSGVVGNPLEVTASPGELTIGYAAIGWEGWLKRLGSYRSKDAAHVRLAIGPDTAVRIATVTAAIEVSHLGADVTLTSASGPVRAERVVGAATARSVSGAIAIHDHRGTARATTVSGAIELTGDLPRVDVVTVSGAAAVTTERPTSMVRAQTVSGALAVTVPEGVGLVLTARTVSAHVSLDGEERRSSGGPGTVQVDERGDGEVAFVDAVTVTGPIAVRRGPVPDLTES